MYVHCVFTGSVTTGKLYIIKLLEENFKFLLKYMNVFNIYCKLKKLIYTHCFQVSTLTEGEWLTLIINQSL